MKKVGVCGVYALGPEFSGGQPVKTITIIEELRKVFGEEGVLIANTLNWAKTPLKLFIDCFKLFKDCENIIMLPAHNGLKIFTPLFLAFNTFFRRKIHYIVIGGWLPDYLSENDKLRKSINKFSGVYVETNTMKTALENLGLCNVSVMNNFKRLSPLSIEQQRISFSEPYKLCIFSRIVKEKGIEDAIRAVIEVNSTLAREVFNLDLYGFIHDHYRDSFEMIMKEVPPYIKYCGVVKPDESVNTLKKYYIQLFPTRYKTEGIPGSIIDSYFAGLPVLASKWDSFCDVIEEGKTGIGFELGNFEDLVAKLKWVSENSKDISEMKLECVKKSSEYTPEYVLGEFIKHLD